MFDLSLDTNSAYFNQHDKTSCSCVDEILILCDLKLLVVLNYAELDESSG